MKAIAMLCVGLSLTLLTGCFTTTRLEYGDLKFSRCDMGWQTIQIPDASFTATNGTKITLTGYTKDSKDTIEGVKEMVNTLSDLTKVLAPMVLSSEALKQQQLKK